jgi:hypothetical protein
MEVLDTLCSDQGWRGTDGTQGSIDQEDLQDWQQEESKQDRNSLVRGELGNWEARKASARRVARPFCTDEGGNEEQRN